MKPVLYVVLISTALWTACGGGNSTPTPQPQPPNPTSVSVSVSPTTASVAATGTQQFTPTVTGNSNTAVNWTVNGVAGGNSTFGTISSSGLYTAPIAPPQENVVVTATSQADTTKSASATVTVQFSKASLNGSYAFLVTQQDNSSRAGFVFVGGTFAADGNGKITSGLEDENSSANGPVTNISFTGVYTVNANGKGSATITDTFGTSTFSFVLTSNTRAQLIEFDGTAVTYGFVQQQNTSQIASLNGKFVFNLFGDSNGPIASLGQLQLSNGVISGTEDFNSLGTVVTNQVLSGTYTVGTAGHGTATVTDTSGSSRFAFYIVDASTVLFLDIDSSGARTAGTALAQNGTFTNASLTSSVFLLSGTALSTNGGFVVAGQFTPDGKGNFTSGVFDENDGGTLLQNSSFTGTYALAANGRGTATVSSTNGSSSFIFWMASATTGFFMESDSTAVASGTVLAQQGSPFSNSSLNGNYGFALGGYTSNGITPLTAVGVLNANGGGTFSGSEDAEQGATLLAGTALNGTYGIAANGRGTGVITGTTAINYAFYVASPHEVIFLAADSTEAFVGLAEQQCSDCH